MKALKIAGAGVAAVALMLALLLIVGIPSGFLTSAIQDRVERQTGYRLTIDGSSRIRLWPTLNVSMGNVTFQDPKNREGTNRVTVGKLQADVSLASVWSGKPRISELILVGPVVHVPLLRERLRPMAGAGKSAAPAEPEAVTIERISISNGTIIFSNTSDRVENRIDGIAAAAAIDADGKIKFAGTARTGDSPVRFEVKSEAARPPIERQTMPVELTFEAPGLLRGPITAKAEVRFNGPVMMMNGLSGTLSDGAFNGWASVDIASKPLVKVDLDLQRLDLSSPNTSTGAAQQGWSEAPIRLNWLNYIDAQVRLSAAQVDIAGAQFGPAAIELALAGGVLKASVANLGTYGGQSSGELIVDATSGSPSYAMHCDLVGVRALPLLQSLADFDKIDGTMQAKIAVKSTGATQHAIISNLSGTAFAVFRDGIIRGLNVAQMIRQLTANTLQGWQEQKEQATDLTQLSASFRIDRGQASTTDLNLVGPLVKMTGAGTVDIGTRMIGFRVEPQLVLTTEGQGRSSDPVGLGIPVMISGPWANPRIYPDVAGILDNPDAAYAKLREMGKGLFGSDGGGLGQILGGLSGLAGNQSGGSGGGAAGGAQGDSLGGLGQTLGTLIQQGLTAGGSVRNRPRGLPSPEQAQSAAQQPGTTEPQVAPVPPPSQESQPMNDVLRQLFNR